MKKSEIKVGMRVVLVKDVYMAKKGMAGVVKIVNSSYCRIGVEFNEPFAGGHTLGGGCGANRGHWIPSEYLELIEETHTTKYKPGDTVKVKSDLRFAFYSMADGKNAMRTNDQMLTKRGKTVKIKSVTKTGKYMIEGSIFPWVDEMFEDDSAAKPTKSTKSAKSTKKVDKNLDWDKFLSGELRITFKSDSDFDAFMKELEDRGIRWSGGEKPTEWSPRKRGECEITYGIWGDSITYTHCISSDMKHYQYNSIPTTYMVTVVFADRGTEYMYLSETKYSAGDNVVVPCGTCDTKRDVKVVKVEDFDIEKLPVPLSKMKYVIGKSEKPAEPKFKVGDKVRVRTDLEAGKCYGMKHTKFSDVATFKMTDMKGKVVTIKDAGEHGYLVNGSIFNWTDEMFEDKPVTGYCGKTVFIGRDSFPRSNCTVGKIYEFVNGQTKDDLGRVIPGTPVKSLKDEQVIDDFIEIVE